MHKKAFPSVFNYCVCVVPTLDDIHLVQMLLRKAEQLFLNSNTLIQGRLSYPKQISNFKELPDVGREDLDFESEQ